jgi:hypothetical protein
MTDLKSVTRPNARTNTAHPYAELPGPITADDAHAEPAADRLLAEREPVAFTRGPARRPQPVVTTPPLQWATGLQTKERTLYAGWLIEAGKDAELDDALSRASFTPVVIKHGQGNLVTHWALPCASLFVACTGIQSMSEMRDDATRYGIAFGWRTLEDGRRQSVLRARVYVQELLAVGYHEPLTLTLKSTLTGDLLSALIAHYDVLDAVNPIRANMQKPPIDVPYYAVAIALTAGAEVARGSGGQTKEIAPMVSASVPTKEYILAHWCRKPWAEAIEAALDGIVAWSISESARIAAGDEPQEGWEG